MSVSYRTTVGDGGSPSSSDPFTFSAVDIGTASATRIVVVGVLAVYSDTGHADIACTIGGVSATKVVGITDAPLGADVAVFLFAANVTTGATGDVVLNPDDASAGMQWAISVWALDGVNGTASDTATSLADPLALNCDVANGDAVVAFGYSADIPERTCTWTGVTENYDGVGSGVLNLHAGSHSSTGSETPRTISGDLTAFASFDAKSGVAAVFPASGGGGGGGQPIIKRLGGVMFNSMTGHPQGLRRF